MDLTSTAQLLGNFGEFIGAIAVVITLIYLAIQVRNSGKAAEASTSQEFMNQLNSINAIFLEKPGVLAAFRELCRDEEMDNSVSQQGRMAMRYMVNTYFQGYVLFQRGTLAPEMWANVHYNAVGNLSTPGGRRWFESQAAADFPNDFRVFVNHEVSQRS